MMRRARKNSKFTCVSMRLAVLKNIVFVTILLLISCGSSTKENKNETEQLDTSITEKVNPEVAANDSVPKIGRLIDGLSTTHIFTGANQWTVYMPLLEGKKVGVVANQTSVVNDTLEDPRTSEIKAVDFHLVDFLIGFNVNVTKTFAPEHGFRGKADAGELIKDGIDKKTGVPIISLYGKNKKPSPKQLEGIEIMVFDIQDVGARFYTYISTLHYLMEACAEANIPVIVMDRPNPNGHYIDGPILEPKHKGFVGMHPIPVVHGMTIGEYAQMINGEGWLKNTVECDLTVIKMKNYTRDMEYELPVKPSPNLPNDQAINLYPSLCFFEGTLLSAGRGTEIQFQIFGAPTLPQKNYSFQFTPQANEGAKYPKFKDEVCFGKDLRNHKRLNGLNLEWLIEAYAASGKSNDFFIPYFTTLAGTETLQQQIEQGLTFREIRTTWLKGLKDYDSMRQPYLIYD